ncbi:endonuclease III, partial [Erythrobacter sp. HI0019]
CNRIGLAQARAADKTAAQLEERSPGWALRDGHFWLIQLGKRICTARAPKCERCPVADLCIFYRATRGS